MTPSDDALERACEALPIFPLPRTVLMPGAMLPLHVFEPRYRALVAHARATTGMFGVATLKPGYEKDYEGRPAIWPEVGVGQIVAFQAYPDGRSDLVLASIGRGLVREELAPRHPFREIRLALRRDPPAAPRATFDRVRELVRQVGWYSVEAQVDARRLLGMDGPALVDALARKLLEDVDEQRRYLREDAADARARLVEGALAEVLAAAIPGGAGEA